MRPKVSVIMPVLNGERYIAEAIGSIAAQTHENCELVVVDDGSTDRTRQIVDSFKDKLEIRYVHHPAPRGIPYSMNDGIRHATGDFISFLDHDDAWFPEFVETEVDYLLEHPETGMVHCDFQTIDSDGNILEASVAACRQRVRPSGRVFRQLFLDSFIVGNSVLIRRECFTKVGLFDESLRWGDYHLWLRIALEYRVDYLDHTLTQYRQHLAQSTRSSANQHPYRDSVVLRAIEKIVEAHPEARQYIDRRTIRRRLASIYFELAYSWWLKQAMREARVCLGRALRLDPANPRFYMLFCATLPPSRLVMRLRELRRRWRGAAPHGDPAAGIIR